MKEVIRYISLLGIGVIIYLLLIPATVAERGGFYIGGEALLILAPLLLDHAVGLVRDSIAELKAMGREE